MKGVKILMTSDLLLERLMSEYGDSILRICYAYLKDYQLAEDATQDTFIKALKSYDSFQNNSSEKTWLTRIAINCCKNTIRTRWFQFHRNELKDHDHVDSNSNIDTLIESTTILDAISELTNSEKELIILYYYQNLSTAEIAQIIGKSTNATVQRLHRARTRLKSILTEAGYGR